MLTSHRGDSGQNQMRPTCTADGRPCRIDGMRHAQLLWIVNVPKVCARRRRRQDQPCQQRRKRKGGSVLTVHAALRARE